MTMDDIVTATDADKVLREVRDAIKPHRWDNDIVEPYKRLKTK